MSEKNQPRQSLIVQTMEEVLHNSMMPYAEYVIMDRAIPRVEDGLKPVQRRILYTMMELGLTPDKPHRKSARIVGDCLGKYHPHGDSSVYDAMVRMAQDFNMQAPLVNGHGNFGSVDGDPAAAMRYTEARMTPLALELLRDIEKETIPYSLNFDDTMKEPELLPGRFPNLLVNGATGIAVGLATNIPPHNLKEAIDASIVLLEDPEASLKKVMKALKGPDFPTGGYILGGSDLESIYEVGRGRVTMRAKTHIEAGKNGKKLIVIDELPYQVNKANALEKILKVSEAKKNLFAPISDIRDESDRNGMRAVIELKRDADPEKMLTYLYKFSDLQVNFNINMVAIANGKPQQMGLLAILHYYNEYQKEIIRKRTKFDLNATERRTHILEGLVKAVHSIDKTIQLIRKSQTPAEAKVVLMKEFSVTEIQAQAILDMRLQRLTNISIDELVKEHEQLQTLVKEYRDVLNDEQKLIAIIKKEMLEIKKKYGEPRRTQFLDEEATIIIDESETIISEDVVVFMTAQGIKRVSAKIFKTKGSGEDTRVLWHVEANTTQRVQLFTSKGNMYSVDVNDIPEPKGKERGIIPSGLIAGWRDDERIVQAYVLMEKEANHSLVFFSKNGLVKRSEVQQYFSRNKRLVACNVKENDEIIDVILDKTMGDIMMISSKGTGMHLKAEAIPVMGRSTAGVKTMRIGRGEQLLAGMIFDQNEGEIFMISNRGYGKKVYLNDFPVMERNSDGLMTFSFKRNRGNGMRLAGACTITEPCTIVIQMQDGNEVRLDSTTIPREERYTEGKSLIKTMENDTVLAVYCE